MPFETAVGLVSEVILCGPLVARQSLLVFYLLFDKINFLLEPILISDRPLNPLRQGPTSHFVKFASYVAKCMQLCFHELTSILRNS